MKYISLKEKYAGLGFFYISISETGKSLSMEINGTSYDNFETALTKVVADYPNITALNIETAMLDDLSIFAPLQNLKKLRIHPGFGGYGDWSLYPMIKDVSPLRELPLLDSLEIYFVGDTFDSFAELKQIRDLKLGVYANHADLEAVGKLVQLEKLNLTVSSTQWSHPRIDSIVQLEGLQNLKSLNVSRIGLKSIAPVKKMKALQYLNCSNNHIRSIKPLETLSELQEVDVSYNKSLRDVSALKKLTNLTKVNLQGTNADFLPDITLEKRCGLWGAFAESGEIIIDFEWEDIQWFQHNGQFGYIVSKTDNDHKIKIALDSVGNVITEERRELLPPGLSGVDLKAAERFLKEESCCNFRKENNN